MELLKILVLGTFCFNLTKNKIMVKLPNNKEKLIFLNNINFIDNLYEWGEVIFPDYINYIGDYKKMFMGYKKIVPITSIRDTDDILSLTNEFLKPQIIKVLENDFKANQTFCENLAGDFVSEVCSNILRHSDSEGYIAVQSHIETEDVTYIPNVEVAVSDGGIGIKESLCNQDLNKYSRKSHNSAIQMVLEGNIPRNDGKDHGGINRICEDLKFYSGNIHIQSIFGECKRFYTEGISPFNRERENEFFMGTHLDIKIPKSNKMEEEEEWKKY